MCDKSCQKFLTISICLCSIVLSFCQIFVTITSCCRISQIIGRLSQISGHNSTGCSRHLERLLYHLRKKAFPFQGGLPLIKSPDGVRRPPGFERTVFLLIL